MGEDCLEKVATHGTILNKNMHKKLDSNFKIHGPITIVKGLFFYYYSEFRLRRMKLDPSTDHAVQVNYNLLVIPKHSYYRLKTKNSKCHNNLSPESLN